jgi:hypothetical protein
MDRQETLVSPAGSCPFTARPLSPFVPGLNAVPMFGAAILDWGTASLGSGIKAASIQPVRDV